MKLDKNDPIEHYINMVNNIPSYYHVEILSKGDIFGINGSITVLINKETYQSYSFAKSALK